MVVTIDDSGSPSQLPDSVVWYNVRGVVKAMGCCRSVERDLSSQSHRRGFLEV